MKLVVGLGNPEAKYVGSRHNVGFWAVERLASRYGAKFAPESKYRSEVATISTTDDKILLVKPLDYYNNTGSVVQKLANFYKIEPHDILLIHDDLALPVGTIRTRVGGSDAGNNGVRSVNQIVGENTKRLRIGTWSALRDQIDDVSFVLGKFTLGEQNALESQISTIEAIFEQFQTGVFETTTYREN